MNYLWEIILKAKEEGIDKNKIRFIHTTNSSPYMELSMDCLNQETLDQINVIEVNTYYRFYQIYKDMFQPELIDYADLRESLTSITLHQLAENDIRKGMTKEEYNKKMLAKDIIAGRFGTDVKNTFKLFKQEEQDTLLSGWLRSYRAGSLLSIFLDMIHRLIADSIVYHGNEASDEILIYTRQKRTWELEQKLRLLVVVFLDIRYRVDIFYEYHFGIIGIEDTMIIDEIAMC